MSLKEIVGKWVICQYGSSYVLVKVVSETPKKFDFHLAPYRELLGFPTERMMKNTIIAVGEYDDLFHIHNKIYELEVSIQECTMQKNRLTGDLYTKLLVECGDD